jgi:hypothetical protein
MRRSLAAALCAGTAALVLAPTAPALAHPTGAQSPTLPTDVTFSSTDNVEYLGRFPEHAGTAGGIGSDDGTLFYLTDPRGVFVYDTTDPADPALLGSVRLFQTQTGAALAQEDPDTDGRILLVDASLDNPVSGSALRVVDVSNPRAPKVIGSLPNVTDHTWTCVSAKVKGQTNGCAYAYGRTGHIVDLTDPTKPVLAGSWRDATGYGPSGQGAGQSYTHDLTEIRPGLVMTAGKTAMLMDTTDPLQPVRLTEIVPDKPFSSLGYHSVEWPRDGRDRWVVTGTEIAPPAAPGLPVNTANLAGSDCQGTESVIETWDASAVLGALEAYEESRDPAVFEGVTFRRADSYDASGRGLFVQGKAAASQLYCAHWMEMNPRFKDGGLMAVAYYNRGTRFVEVGKDGVMTEVGWITPAEGYTGSPQWVADDLVYVMDYRRGLEIVRLLPEEATRVVRNAPDVIAPASSAAQLPLLHLHGRDLALGAGVLLLVAFVVLERVARRRSAVRAA